MIELIIFIALVFIFLIVKNNSGKGELKDVVKLVLYSVLGITIILTLISGLGSIII